METLLSVPEQPGLLLPRRFNEDVRRCVEHQEWLERVVPRTAFWSVFGTAVLMLLNRNGWQVTGGALIGGVAALFVAKLVAAIVVGGILEPARTIRYRRATKKLSLRLETAADLTCRPCTWYTGAPGAFAPTSGGDLLLADRSSGYEFLRLTPDQIAGVSVEREVTQVTQTRHSGRSVVGGGLGGGFFGASVRAASRHRSPASSRRHIWRFAISRIPTALSS